MNGVHQSRAFPTSAEGQTNHLVLFVLDEQSYALRLSAVEQVVRMVEITPLPNGPEIILGVVNIQGRIVPIFDLRKRFRLPEQEIRLSDHLMVARTRHRTVALVVDRVIGMVPHTSGMMTPGKEVFPGLEYVEGVVKIKERLVFIQDLETFLSGGEEQSLKQAMARGQETM